MENIFNEMCLGVRGFAPVILRVCMHWPHFFSSKEGSSSFRLIFTLLLHAFPGWPGCPAGIPSRLFVITTATKLSIHLRFEWALFDAGVRSRIRAWRTRVPELRFRSGGRERLAAGCSALDLTVF